MAWSSEDRRKFLRALDETESRLLVLYRYLLYFLIVSVTVLAVLFYRSVAKDAFRDFLRLFGGILYLTFLAWAASAESINPKRDRLVESHLSKNERWANRLIGKAAPAQSLHLRGTGARLRGRRPTVSDDGEPKRMAPKSEWDGRRWP